MNSTKATFFVLGSIADEMPELVREVVDRGHEVASKGYIHRSIDHFGPEEFREDLVRSREALERVSAPGCTDFRIGRPLVRTAGPLGARGSHRRRIFLRFERAAVVLAVFARARAPLSAPPSFSRR